MTAETDTCAEAENEALLVENRIPKRVGMTHISHSTTRRQSNSSSIKTEKLANLTTDLDESNEEMNGNKSQNGADDEKCSLQVESALATATCRDNSITQIPQSSSKTRCLGSDKMPRFENQEGSQQANPECKINSRYMQTTPPSTSSVASESKTNSLNSHNSLNTAVSKHSTRDSFIGRSTKSMGMWSRFVNNYEDWKHQDIHDFDEDEEGNCSKIATWCQSNFWSMKTILYTALHNPFIILVSFIVFAIIMVSGLVAVQALARIYAKERKNKAEELALHSGISFSKALDDAGRGPLFAISQFVKHLDEFKHLPHEIGQRDDFGLLPDHLAPPLPGKEKTHRDLSNTNATSPHLVELFNDIAANAKKDAGLEGILVSLQLAPMGVVSMIYPLINREDFEPPIYMNNTGAIGHDLLFDKRRTDGARKTLSSDKPVVVGPLTLIQGDTPVVKEAFIMRLAINMTGYLINVPQENAPDVPYESWGFAVVLLNWAEAKEKTGLYEVFKKNGMEFTLTRVDTKLDPITNTIEKKIVQIANSSRWDVLNEQNSVQIKPNTTNNEWTMTVGYEDGIWPIWSVWMQVLVSIISFAIGIMIMIVLVVRKQYQNLLYSMMPPQIVKRLRKSETFVQMYEKPTIYFSDIVGYTSMSEIMSPMEVMAMLNEIYTEFDILVRKHGIYKLETIGDAYLVIGGGPDGNSSVEGAKRIALFALDVLKFVKDYRTKQGLQIHLRCGLASGPVVGAVVGIAMPKFSIFGDTVNTAARMESTSKPMRIQCNGLTYNMLRESRDVQFLCQERTEDCTEEGMFIKGKGFIKTWWVNGIAN